MIPEKKVLSYKVLMVELANDIRISAGTNEVKDKIRSLKFD